MIEQYFTRIKVILFKQNTLFNKEEKMGSFFKSFLLTIVIHNVLLVLLLCFTLLSTPNPIGDVVSFFLFRVMVIIGIFTLFDLVFMFLIGVPFFAITRKFANFSWFFGILMGFLMGCAITLFIFATNENVFSVQVIGSFVLGITFGLIFAPIHYFFKKRQKPALVKVDEVFS